MHYLVVVAALFYAANNGSLTSTNAASAEEAEIRQTLEEQIRLQVAESRLKWLEEDMHALQKFVWEQREERRAQAESNFAPNSFTLEPVAVAVAEGAGVGGAIGFSGGLRSGRTAHFRAGVTSSPSGGSKREGILGALLTATLQFPFHTNLRPGIGAYSYVDIFWTNKTRGFWGIDWHAGVLASLDVGLTEELFASGNVGLGYRKRWGAETGSGPDVLGLATVGLKI